jgi:hypothetical protein
VDVLISREGGSGRQVQKESREGFLEDDMVPQTILPQATAVGVARPDLLYLAGSCVQLVEER